ncbi:MAG: hypothetical protein QGF59_00445, partial [Pirellulaceae bacterium]|nr:hypothetical protein [Pirellulaceae bacterium]
MTDISLALLAFGLILALACTKTVEVTSTPDTSSIQPTVSLFVPTPTATVGPTPTATPVPANPTPPPSPSPSPTPTPAQISTLPEPPEPTVTNRSVSFAEEPGEYLLFNQRIIEGLSAQDLDIQNVDQVFGHIFSRLPDEVTVYPSENYYYFVLYADQRQFWGNMRLPSGQREDGLLSFAYFEFDEFPVGQRTGLTRSKFYDAEDGVIIRE